jgi:RNA polymerase sigma-70 factor, ECF subfamily
MQEAFASALGHWQERGIPENPGAWITAVAQRKLIDYVRRERTKIEKQDVLLYETEMSLRKEDISSDATSMTFPDDRLRLIFTCCHPALNLEAQVALTLRTLGGLTTPEIARAFLAPEATMAQRLVRAKTQDSRCPHPLRSAAGTSLARTFSGSSGGDLSGFQRRICGGACSHVDG